jgi:hypothetical protein
LPAADFRLDHSRPAAARIGIIEVENDAGDDPIRICTPPPPMESRWAPARTERAVYSTYNPCARIIYR